MVLLTEKELKNLTHIQLIEYIIKLHKLINNMNEQKYITTNDITSCNMNESESQDCDECIICGQCLCEKCFNNIKNSHCPICN